MKNRDRFEIIFTWVIISAVTVFAVILVIGLFNLIKMMTWG